MAAFRPLCQCTALFLLAAVVASGCARTCSLVAQRPAAANVQGVTRLAVMHFRGPGDAGQKVRATIETQLRQNGFYTLVDPAELQRSVPDPLYGPDGRLHVQQAIRAGRRIGLDAILVGKVRYREGTGYDLGQVNFQLGDPELAAVVDYRLIDVRTGRALAEDRAEQTCKSESSEIPADSSSNAKMLARLARDSALEVAGKVAPYEQHVNVRLAGAVVGKGAAEIRAGNRSARAGDWETAARHWQAALAAKPDSHAALYNLGLAHEARYDFDLARRFYTAAAQQHDRDSYREAIERVDRAAADYQLAAAQRRRIGATQLCRLPAVNESY